MKKPNMPNQRRREDTPPSRTAANNPPVAAKSVPRRCQGPGLWSSATVVMLRAAVFVLFVVPVLMSRLVGLREQEI